MGRPPRCRADYISHPDVAEMPGTLDVVKYGRIKVSGIELFVSLGLAALLSKLHMGRQIANWTANGNWQLAISYLFLGTANFKSRDGTWRSYGFTICLFDFFSGV